MSPLGLFLLAVVVIVPVAWLVAEFRSSRSIRITLGLLAISVTTVCTSLVISIAMTFNYNAWYGGASKSLLTTTISEIEDGNIDRVMNVLRRLDVDYATSYMNRARYDEAVNEAVSTMKGNSNLTGTKWEVSSVNANTWTGHWEEETGFWIVVNRIGSDYHVVRSGTAFPPIVNVTASKDFRTLSFDDGMRWHHELTIANKYEATHSWRELDSGKLWRAATLHKLIRATPEQRHFTQAVPKK